MKKLFLFLALALIFFLVACELFNPDNLPLTNNLEDDSTLDLNLSHGALNPPVNIKFLSFKTESEYETVLYWGSVEDAIAYKVYRSSAFDGEYALLGETSSPSYRTVEISILENFSTYTSFYKVASVSATKKESTFSVPLVLTINQNLAYEEIVVDPIISKGTQSTITLTWTPPQNVSHYKIFRLLSESDSNTEPTLLHNEFIPPSSNASQIDYVDSTAKAGYFYDYHVLPVDQYGNEGILNKGFKAGYILPEITNFEVSNGTLATVVSSGVQTEGQIELYWNIYPYIHSATSKYKLGEMCALLGYALPDNLESPEDFGIYVSFTPANPRFSDLINTVFLSNFLPDANDADLAPLSALKKYETLNEQFLIDDTLIDDSSRGRLYTYRVKVVNKNYPLIQFDNSWYKYFYFKVSSKFYVAGSGYIESKLSTLFRGWEVNSVNAPVFNNGTEIFQALTTVKDSLEVNIEIKYPGHQGSTKPDAIRIYKAVPGGIKYDLVNEWTTIPAAGSTLAFTEELSTPIEEGMSIPYRFSIIQNGRESIFSDPEYLIIEGE